MKVTRPIDIFLLLLILGGLMDSAYLTYEHYAQTIPPCTLNTFADCGRVLNSTYSVVYGIPLALLGLMHYAAMLGLALLVLSKPQLIWKRLLFLSTAVGVVVSLFLVYLQLFVIGAICLFCMLSAAISFTLYFVARHAFWNEYHRFLLKKVEITYKLFAKPLFFFMDAEFVHHMAMKIGNFLGKILLIRVGIKKIFLFHDLRLRQKIRDMEFKNPIGLAAGYDYEAAFPQILPSFGFGFETIGTITHSASEGNPKPRLGRLPKSQALLVNKGFRNPGADVIIQKIENRSFEIPIGISIGITNSKKLKKQKEGIADILQTFMLFEKSLRNHSYYELNISCPNLSTNISFYEPRHLKELLEELAKLKVIRPVFIKMPIEKSNEEVKKMLDIIVPFRFITGVIFGNLQKNRKDPRLDPVEVARVGKGNFSGKPTEKRSNELIQFTYKKYGKKLLIIGCGGVFSAHDAYTKIRLGASLVQLITGMIFEGPQLISQINRELVLLLKKDGYNHLAEAIGVDS